MFSTMFNRIVVPYDGSSHSKKALKRALEVAHNLESEILLFSVINIGYISPPGMLKGLVRSRSEKLIHKRWEKTVKKETEHMLSMALNECQKKGIPAKFYLGHGNVAEEIIKFAKKRRATIIIIGSRGLHGLKRLKTLGSISRKVSEHAHCPVLIIR